MSSSSRRPNPASPPEPPDASPEPAEEPAPEPAADAGAEAQGKEGKEGKARGKGTVPLKSTASLERLRDRVELAAQELTRLRKENDALTARLRELETRPAVKPDETLLALEESPEAVRRKVEGFIEAIDRYLSREQQNQE